MTSKFLVSTTDTELCVGLGDDALMSTIPETKGADILLYTQHGLFCWQRKAIPNDFITSFTDGRLARAIPLMKESCAFQRIIGEGRFKYYPDGTVDMGRYRDKKPVNTRFKKQHVKNMINDIELIHGVTIDWTENLQDTIHYLRCIRAFLQENKHLGLFRRPSAKGAWIVPTARDVDLWILQSWPGIGPATADAIIQSFGGEIPLKWTCTFEQLVAVKGMTVAKAKAMWESLPTSAPLPSDILTKKVSRSTAMVETFESVYGKSFDNMRSKLGKKNA